jgi:hypothetical protein
VEGNWHGVWGGYSFDSQWINNGFAWNTEGIAIEHGQNNQILGNSFHGDETAIRLWQNASQDPNWGYPKHRDTRSRAYRIGGNNFRRNKVALDIRSTLEVDLHANVFNEVQARVSPESVALNPDSGSDRVIHFSPPPVPRLPDGIDPMIKNGERRGRSTIIVDEWGPYDWKSPKLWPEGKPDETPLKLRVLGLPGSWKVKSVRGATVTPPAGSVGEQIDVTPRAGRVIDYDVALEYRGGTVISPRGAITKSGAPYPFRYSRFFAPAGWTVRFYQYGDSLDPSKHAEAFNKLLAGTPIKIVTVDRLDYMSGRTIEEGVPRDRVAFTADGAVDLPAGDYTLQIISDDGARVWVDGILVLDAWDPHESRVDRVPLRGGRHTLKVHYFEVGGWAEMRLDIQRSSASDLRGRRLAGRID